MNEESPQLNLSEAEFVALLVKHEPILRAYARVILPDWDLVDESLQEASATMWQKRGQLASADGFLPWAKVIVRFKCLHQVERLRQRRLLLSDAMLETLVDRGASGSAIEVTRRGRALRECLNQFSAEHRELLLAPHSSTDTVVSLAGRRKKSPNALYKLLGRLRAQLLQCIRDRLAAEST